MTAEAEDAPGEHAQRVGRTIRQLRNSQGLSLRDVAADSGLSTGFLSLVERGLNSPSLTTLFSIADSLGVTAADLIGETPKKSKPTFAVTRAASDDSPKISLGDRTHQILSGNLPGQSLEALKTTVFPTKQASAPSSHGGEEFCYVLEGELSFHFASDRGQELTETVVVGEGDSLHFQSSTPHAIHNATNRPVEALWVVDHPLITPPGVWN
ncbi:XRE family transcriptional regulator [Brevibacterium sp. SMBL_HHYL_HB1]|uniref:helix-turn-helix domain-containing protein n=1 Tax=Brevibacterium sp. SMBL_HHYL_HB1 TaxID=2777556 RepID=UPI001BAB0F7F|nr:XRE family transcriptional regulator [Brevibacterium sp. SMBL_HHYL_HB1]QUL80264.1 helix-turn-helix transcriptional regulator [Brevibacterium sp. SMBL_HHYL_HB1]